MFAIAFRGLCLASLLLAGFSLPAESEDPVRVFAAASLSVPLDTILEGSGYAQGVYGSSGTLARQIVSGAPADIFISADPRWSTYLIEQAVAEQSQISPFIGNSLVIVGSTNSDAKRRFDEAARDWLLSDRIAIGDPDHVPAGNYAKQALTGVGLWDDLRSEAVRAPSVRAALAFVEQEAVGYGIVYRSDAMQSTRVTLVASIPAELHDQIAYTITVLNDRPETIEIAAILSSSKAKEVLTEAGFVAIEDSQ